MIKPLLAVLTVILSACASTAQYTHAPDPLLPRYREPNGPYEYTSTYQHSTQTYVRTPQGWRYVVWHPHNLVSAETSPGYLLSTEEALGVVDGFVSPEVGSIVDMPSVSPSAEAPVPRSAPTGLASAPRSRADVAWERFCDTQPMSPGELELVQLTPKPDWLTDCLPLK